MGPRRVLYPTTWILVSNVYRPKGWSFIHRSIYRRSIKYTPIPIRPKPVKAKATVFSIAPATGSVSTGELGVGVGLTATSQRQSVSPVQALLRHMPPLQTRPEEQSALVLQALLQLANGVGCGVGSGVAEGVGVALGVGVGQRQFASSEQEGLRHMPSSEQVRPSPQSASLTQASLQDAGGVGVGVGVACGVGLGVGFGVGFDFCVVVVVDGALPQLLFIMENSPQSWPSREPPTQTWSICPHPPA